MSIRLLLAAWFAWSWVFLTLCHAYMQPVRTVSGLWNPAPETMKRASKCKVVIADYILIRNDFIHTRTLTDEQIKDWLIRETCFVSKAQADQELVNSKIHTTGETRIGQRPAEYRRGIVFEVQGGLLDAKGTGSLDPSPGSHNNGLTRLAENIREFFYEKLVHRLFRAKNSPFTTVGTYAVMAYDFDIKEHGRQPERASYILRQANNRFNPESQFLHAEDRNWGILLPKETAKAVETELRHFGITSAGANREAFHYDLLNVQGTQAGAVIDFGAFLTVPSPKGGDHLSRGGHHLLAFPREARIFHRSRYNHSLVWEYGTSPQPDPNFRVPFDLWGYSISGIDNPKKDNVSLKCEEFVKDWVQGKADEASAQQLFHHFMDPIDQMIANAKTHCVSSSMAKLLRSQHP
jgi:hypothetical protein